jgi:hypothetical protein
MTTTSTSSIPPDDPRRSLSVAKPDADQALPHVCVVGATYTVLFGAKDTAGPYSLIDMLSRRIVGHRYTETTSRRCSPSLAGRSSSSFGGQKTKAGAGETINIPANAPHHFTNASGSPARMLCLCTPPGQEEFFLAIGDRVATRTSPPPPLSDDEKKERMERAKQLAAEYRTELL